MAQHPPVLVIGSGPLAPAGWPGPGMVPGIERNTMSTEHDQRMMNLARALPEWSIPDIILARKCAGKLHRADEMQCNGDAYLDDDERWVDSHGRPCRNPYGRAAKTLDTIAASYGWTWYHQTDPRGRSVYLLSPEVLRDLEARGVALDAGYSRGVAL